MKEERVCAGVVTYNPNLDLLEQNLNSLYPQVAEVFVVDNGSNNKESLNTLLSNYNNLRVCWNSKNYGIAQALNLLCALACKCGYSWIVTMDQDSVCDGSMIQYLAEYLSPRYGILAPCVVFKDEGVVIHAVKNHKDQETSKISACITSGSLTNLDAWKSVGGFDEWFFIDHVDNEFCTHIIQKGYEIVRINKAKLHQRAGEMRYIKLPHGKILLLPYYSPLRNYYICRNTIYYIRKYWRNINLYLEIRSFIYSQIIKLTFEKGRRNTLISSLRGICDGLRKKIEYKDYCSAQ